MRQIVILFILVLSIASCKKGDSEAENVDPREQYIGIYDIDYTSKTLIGTIDFNEDSGKGLITFSKGDAANELKMTTEFPGLSSVTDVVKLDGTKFSINRTRDQMRLGNKQYDAEFLGSGLFEGKVVTVTSVTTVNQSGTVAKWTRSYKGSKR
ncbi:hypothetical protein GCM10028803_26160 [Larkinella knui]|uniref:Lipocalin-like domain-containing protein n=1 Tax=Larkinella knui TaxID=2025310 RepID=A0A3P1CWG8_9BACT|nr:hypothetical protein [Larkinella knui]RRB17665.1 hypothetical protein EHT87_05115 [Larkinella knui]